MTTAKDRAARIAALNDDFRKHCPAPGSCSGKVVLTSGIGALGGDAVGTILDRIAAFDAFTGDNDPYGERDFGSVDYDGNRIFFKIDYFDTALQSGSEDPVDPTKTTRVLTVMLAEEY